MKSIVAKFFIILFVGLISFSATAGCYDETLKAAKAAYNRGKYSYARQCFVAAKQCPDAPANAVSVCNEWIRKIDNPPQPSQPSVGSETQYQKDLTTGERLFDSEKYAEAKKHFQSMLKKYPKHKTDINQWIKRCDKFIIQDSSLFVPSTTSFSGGSNNSYSSTQSPYVDLGLSVKWATCNIGASSPYTPGDYFTWGETSTKNTYTTDNCKSQELYLPDISGSYRFDAATVVLGDLWRIPTKDECQELAEKCTWTRTTQGGSEVYKVTGPNGNYIYMPLGGYYDGNSLSSLGDFGYYHTSNQAEDDENLSKAYFLGIGEFKIEPYVSVRYYGRNIRPVYVGSGSYSTEVLSDYSDIDFVDQWLRTMRAESKNFVQSFSDNGIEVDYSIKYNSSQRQIVQIYDLYSSSVYESIDIYASRSGTITGLVNGSINEDASGKSLEYVISEFKKYGLAIVNILRYNGAEKRTTPFYWNDIQAAYDELYGDRQATSSYDNRINGYEYVDMGLSVKWATCNIGASSPEDFGNHYAWGETKTKSYYDENNSRTYGEDYTNIGGNSYYDAASAIWGASWRLPTKSELEELINRCSWKWTKINGINGYEITSEINGNSIFLPAAGELYDDSHGDKNSMGLYWSSDPESNTYSSYHLRFLDGGRKYFISTNARDTGLSIRPVAD